MKKIRILYTIPNFDTAGSGKALLNLALGLDPTVFEPHILCLHDRGEFFKTVVESGIPIHVFDYISQERPIFKMLLGCYRVSRKIREINPDIVHSFHYSSNYTEALATRFAGKKWVFTKKNMSWGGSSKNSWKFRSFLANQIAVQNTDMEKEFYPRSDKTMLIPRGVNIEKFRYSAPDPLVKSFMNTPENQRVLICVANLVPVKGIEILIKAYDLIHKEYPDWVLWIVGDDTGVYAQNLKELVTKMGLNEKILFSGKQMNVVTYLNHAELFILPTNEKGEGSPVALLEAMANGKVVLGSRVPGIKDQLNDFPNHLFTPKSESELAEKLSFFMDQSKEELRQLGKGFYKLVCESYSIEREIKNHEEFYRRLIT